MAVRRIVMKTKIKVIPAGPDVKVMLMVMQVVMVVAILVVVVVEVPG